jgi:NADH:ubiquinone reductase (H+-translocating)
MKYQMKREKIVIIGGGFGGLNAAKYLAKNNNAEIILIDRTNHHLFQPLLYQVATSALSPGDIAAPIRGIFAKQKNLSVIMEEVISIDKDKKLIATNFNEISFDKLIIAAGAKHSYFNNPQWEEFAPGLKTLTDALTIRENILSSLEHAEKLNDPVQAEEFLNFIIVGGGPTGVELAGAIAEIVNRSIIKDYRNINTSLTNVFLIEALPQILLGFPGKLSLKAKETLEKMGVEVLVSSMVTNVTNNGVQIGGRFIKSRNIIWAAGNTASPLLKSLNVETDRSGRVIVEPDLSIKNYPDIFVIGDSAACMDASGNFLPAIAPVAIQQGKYAAQVINKPEQRNKPFKYADRGIMATIGRAKAVASIKRFEFSGFAAWIVWSLVHIMFLIGFRNRFRVMIEWLWYYITFRHGFRLIIGRNTLI